MISPAPKFDVKDSDLSSPRLVLLMIIEINAVTVFFHL